MSDKIVVLGYGIFLAVGAYFGWKAGSSQSLMMGLVSAALVFIGFYLTTSNPKVGFMMLSAVGGILTVVFIMRLIATHKFMPSGMLLAITVGFLIYCLTRLR